MKNKGTPIQEFQQEIQQATGLNKLVVYDKYLNLFIRQNNLEQSLKTLGNYRKEAESQNNQKYLCEVKLQNLYLLFLTGNHTKAQESVDQVLKDVVTYGDKVMIIRAYGSAGMLFRGSHNDRSLGYMFKSLESARQINDEVRIGLQLCRIADLHVEMKKVDETIVAYYKEAILKFKKANNQLHLANAHSGLYTAYNHLSKKDLAHKSLLEAQKIAEESEDKFIAHFVNPYVADYYFESQQYEKCIITCESLISEAKSPYKIGYFNLKKGQSYWHLGNLSKAKEAFKESLHLTPKEHVPNLLGTKEYLEKIALKEEDYKAAHQLVKEQFELYKEINNTEVNDKVVKMQTQFETERKDRQNAELKLKALRSQMNPHFIFNSLNAIQSYVASSNNVDAIKYIAQFAQLMRQILENSNQVAIPLEEQINFIQNYLRLEALRYNQSFQYTIEVDDEVESDIMKVPPMIIQPYVENAILHGMKNKKEGGFITISYTLLDEENKILCIVEDNGQGRTKQKEIKQTQSYKSMGTKITEERLQAINQDDQLNVHIIDLKNEDGSAEGTRVEVFLPILE